MRYAILALVLLFGCAAPPPEPDVTANDTMDDGIMEEIDSFEECVAAGNPVMESYPRQCRAGDRTFVSLTDLFDVSKDTSCETDDDCRLVNAELGFSCCWAGACEQIDYSLEKWVAVNKDWYESEREKHCPSDCGPAPGCAVRAVNENFTAVCSESICEKVPIVSANLTATNITGNETEQINETIEENETEVQGPPAIPEGIHLGGYLLVLDDIVIYPESEEDCGAFSIMLTNGTVVDKLIICERQSKYWITPEGHKYRIFVVKLAAGYTMQENWADVRVYG